MTGILGALGLKGSGNICMPAESLTGLQILFELR